MKDKIKIIVTELDGRKTILFGRSMKEFSIELTDTIVGSSGEILLCLETGTKKINGREILDFVIENACDIKNKDEQILL